jgi:carboxypeptidase Q
LEILRLSAGARSACVRAVLAMAVGCGAAAAGTSADPPTQHTVTAVPAATLARIVSAAMQSDWAYQRLADLTDKVGPRPAGSAGFAAAATQVADAMRAIGAQVSLQPAKVTHWVRGEERGELIDYAGRPPGITQQLHLTALGSSATTGAGGLEARVIVVRDFNDLQAHAAEVRGRIVLFDSRFDQRLADNGRAGAAYGQAGQYRVHGPAAAAALGAAAALVRSIGGADYRLPHTGVTQWNDGQQPIPAGALSAEDSDLIKRLVAQGPVTMRLLLTPQSLPDTENFNVIADWPGTVHPDEYVVVSGHLDSWDLGTGATDDGSGVMAAAGVVQVLAQLQLHARRSIRFIGWADEEYGGRGGRAYLESLGEAIGSQCAALESDLGAGRALGVQAAVAAGALDTLQPVMNALAPIGATVLEASLGEVGTDIGPLQEAGVPSFSPLADTRHYFDYHHTAADTLDKVDPVNLQSQVATMAALAFFLADRADCLPRLPVDRDRVAHGK